MSLQTLIETYGYWALFIGTFLEGETIVVLAGFAAHQGYLQLEKVVLISFLGSLLGDQLYFFLGRIKGREILKKRPKWKPMSTKIQPKLEKHQTLLILGFRFVYGFRTVTPIVIGMSNIKTSKFAILNSISAAIWATAIATGGYFFGDTLQAFLGDVKYYELSVIVAIGVAGAIIWIIHFFHMKKDKMIYKED